MSLISSITSVLPKVIFLGEGSSPRRLPLSPIVYSSITPGSATLPLEFNSHLTEHLGHCIGTINSPGREDTKALYLRDRKTNQVLLLTLDRFLIRIIPAPTQAWSCCLENMFKPNIA